MPGKPKDITGQKFGRLTVLSFHGIIKGRAWWNCKCDCGNEIIAKGVELRYGSVVSCGCKKREFLIKLNTKHNLSKHPLYHVIADMIERCYNPNSQEYFRYGKRGITVCDEWRNDKCAFIIWGLANGYQKGLQIDRIDNNKDYCPENCRFVTPKVNTNNRRITVKTNLFGKVMCVSEIAEMYGLSQDLIRKRIKKGLKNEDLIKGGCITNG